MPGNDRQTGDVLDARYRLVERLGQGGFGDVWRAEELLPDGKALREVALKLLRRGVISDWAEEARIIASLRHPGLVTIYVAGLVRDDDGPLPFVAMELLLGENLAAFVERGEQVAWRRVLSWAREAAAALDEIHRAGVVHLDLKPANLFLTRAGSLKVLDFGIAQQGQARAEVLVAGDDGMSTAAFIAQETPPRTASATATGTSKTVVGTPGFMAPEVIEGGEATAASDAYALAACVVQLVTGKLPQDARDRPARDERTSMQQWLSEVQSATVHGRLRDLASARLPRGLRELVLRWLRLDPVARGAEVGSLRRQLDAVWLRPHGASRTPFPGVAAYGLEDEGNLHGRRTEIERLARELVHQPCLVLQGPSGAGLTSLALAGIVPELGRAGTDGLDDWRACHVRLGDDPDASLDEQLSAWLNTHGSPASSLTGEADAHCEEGSLCERLLAQAHHSRIGLALVVEDLHAIVTAPARATLVREIADAIVTGAVAAERSSRAARGLRLIGLVREEHTGSVLATELGRDLLPWVRYLGLPSWSAAEELVRGPLAAVHAAIDDDTGLIEDVKRELGREGASLATISLALSCWWRSTRTAASWREQGGLFGPLSDHAENLVGQLERDEGWMAEALLLRLMRADGTAIEVDARELEATSDDARRSAELVAKLVEARVVLARGGKLRLAHPALAQRWPRLHNRRLNDLERLSFFEELREAAQRWKAAGGSPGELWSARRLRELERRFADGNLGNDERAFLAASVARRNKRRMIQGMIGATLLALLVIAGVLDKARRERAEERERALERLNREAAIGYVVTLSRRTADPYQRVALLAAAVDAGSADPLLPIELFTTVRGLPPARFLALDVVERPSFPWNERYLLAHTRAQAMLVDLEPDEGDAWGPVGVRIQPHAEGLFDVEPIPFDHAFVTRSVLGQLKVWRLRENRQVALAATSPMRCLRGVSRLVVAKRAPVIACSTAEGLARWDLREASKVHTDSFGGRVLDISPDGAWIAAARQHKVLVWRDAARRFEIDLEEQASGTPPLGAVGEPSHVATAARFSPRDDVIAIIDPTEVRLFDLTATPPNRIAPSRRLVHGVGDPSDARFAASGLDLAVCDHEGEGTWLYLRNGPRPESDGPAPHARDNCAAERRWPERLEKLSDYGEPILSAHGVGPRQFSGGFKRQDGRIVTRDLVAFDPKDRRLQVLSGFVDPNDTVAPGISAVAVARDGDQIVWQLGSELAAFALDGSARWRKSGNLLGRCEDGRVLAWRREGEDRWVVFDAKTDAVQLNVARTPGFVVGMDPACARFFVQWLDGKLASVALGARGAKSDAIVKPTPIEPGGGSYVLEGYVFDSRASAGGVVSKSPPEEVAPGLWLALSSGALVRVDAHGNLASYGHASSRATAMTDGPRPGELIFADETGMVLRARSRKDRQLLGPSSEHEWSDARVLPGAKYALVASASALAVLDLERPEIVGQTEVHLRGRLARWDDEGSTLLWSYAFMGGAKGDVVPIGKTLAGKIAGAASNLVAQIAPDGRPVLRFR